MLKIERWHENAIKIRSFLWQGLLGEISLEDMKEAFKSSDIIFSHGINIHIDPNAIIHVLEKFLAKEIDRTFIKEWALFILMLGCYVSPNYEYCEEHLEDHTAADKYEKVWTVFQQLSCPEIDGELTEKRAKDHIAFLKKFMKENS